MLNIYEIGHQNTLKMLCFKSFWPTQACTIPDGQIYDSLFPPGYIVRASVTTCLNVLAVPWHKLVSELMQK
jgi:hypothetical protein